MLFLVLYCFSNAFLHYICSFLCSLGFLLSVISPCGSLRCGMWDKWRYSIMPLQTNLKSTMSFSSSPLTRTTNTRFLSRQLGFLTLQPCGAHGHNELLTIFNHCKYHPWQFPLFLNLSPMLTIDKTWNLMLRTMIVWFWIWLLRFWAIA